MIKYIFNGLIDSLRINTVYILLDDPIIRNSLIKYQFTNIILLCVDVLLSYCCYYISQLILFMFYIIFPVIIYPFGSISIILSISSSIFILLCEIPILIIQNIFLQDFINQLSIIYKVKKKSVPITDIINNTSDTINRAFLISSVIAFSKYSLYIAIIYLPLINSLSIFDILFSRFNLSLYHKVKIIESNIIYFYCYGLFAALPTLYCISHNINTVLTVFFDLLIFPLFIISSYNSCGCNKIIRIYIITPILYIMGLFYYVVHKLIIKFM